MSRVYDSPDGLFAELCELFQEGKYFIFEHKIDSITFKEKQMGVLEFIQEQREIYVTERVTEQVETQKNTVFVQNLLQKTDFSMQR
jgi:hypothetical protein